MDFFRFTFLYPEAKWLWLLLLPMLLTFFIWMQWQQRVAVTLGKTPERRFSYGKQFTLWLLPTNLLFFALLYPQGYPQRIPVPSTSSGVEKEELLFILDTSASMGVNDGEEGKSRLDEAKELIGEIAAHNPSVWISLYGLSDGLLSLVPPTIDHMFFSLVLDRVKSGEGGVVGSNFPKALEQLTALLQDRAKDQQSLVLLFSDGEHTASSAATPEMMAKLLPPPEELSYRLDTIGMGTESGGVVPGAMWDGKSVVSKMDGTVLRTLAEEGGGTFFPMQKISSRILLNEIKPQLRPQRTPSGATQGILIEGAPLYQIPAALSLLLFLVIL